MPIGDPREDCALVCSGPSGGLFVFVHSEEPEGIGCICRQRASQELEEIARAVVPRYANKSEQIRLEFCSVLGAVWVSFVAVASSCIRRDVI
mmetsp:Transcript_99806/g.268056  ORF Transcript_99806/g.268056 Transcript_99806/m.268056 type:complete len:92 (-) Transcript_99806:14-289(-)